MMASRDGPHRRTRPFSFFALLWWVGILLLLPFGRSLVDTLRSRGLLAMVVSAGIVLTLIAVAATATRWHRSGRLSQRSYLVAFALSAALVLLAQLLPRVEERWHCVQYGILGGLCWGAVRGRLRPWLTATMIVAAAGWLDEGVQWFLPERVYDFWDVALNAVSGAAGAGVAEVSRRASRKSELLEAAQ